jgi:hypothetical protein
VVLASKFGVSPTRSAAVLVEVVQLVARASQATEVSPSSRRGQSKLLVTGSGNCQLRYTGCGWLSWTAVLPGFALHLLGHAKSRGPWHSHMESTIRSLDDTFNRPDRARDIDK